MKDSGKGPTPFEREVRKRRLIVEILILVFLVLIGIMVNGLVNTAIEAARYAKMTPTPTLTPYVRVTRTPTPTVTLTPTPGPVVMIDPGHGGNDVGAGPEVNADVYEKIITLSIGMKVCQKLQDLGFTVIMTREDDSYVSLKDRRESYNASEAEAFVSIHLDAFDGDNKASGCTVHYCKGRNENSPFLAECLVNGICDSTGARNRGVKNSDYEVLLSPKPSVLIECGFMSSENEYPLLKDEGYQELIAQGIADGLVKFFKKMNGADR